MECAGTSGLRHADPSRPRCSLLIARGCGGTGTRPPRQRPAPAQSGAASAEARRQGRRLAKTRRDGRAGHARADRRPEVAGRRRQGRGQGGRGAARADADELPLAPARRVADQGRAADRRRSRSGSIAIAAYVPPSNPMTKGKVELGKQLYFDPRVSLDGTVSCATCHNPEKGWTDSLHDVGRHRRPGRRPERPDGAEHGLRPDDVLGRPRPLARRPGAGADPEPDRDGQAVVQGDHRAAPDDLGLHASSSRRSSAPT